MNVISRVAIATACLLPAGAFAQEAPGIDATVTLSYSFGDMADYDYNTAGVFFSSDIRLSQSIAVGLDFDLQSTDADIEGIDAELDVTRFSVEPRYNFGKGFYGGLYYQSSDVDISLDPLLPVIELGAEINSYGLFGGYDTDVWGVELYIGQTDTDPSIDDLDITDYGVAGYYKVSEAVELFGSYQKTNIGLPSGGPDLDLDLFAVGGSYDFQNGLSAYGTIGRVSLDVSDQPIDGSITQYALGLNYGLGAAGSSVPATISFEIARQELDADIGPDSLSESGTTYTVGVTIPLGNGSSEPLNSSSRIARGGVRTPLASTLMSF